MLDTKTYIKELLSEPVKDFNWFADGVIPKMKRFDIRNKSGKGFKHIAFRSEKLSGHIDFWDSGMVEIYIMDNDTGKELIDLLLEPPMARICQRNASAEMFSVPTKRRSQQRTTSIKL